MMPVLAGVLGRAGGYTDTLVIHDAFGGSGNVVGTLPDTVNNGEQWGYFFGNNLTMIAGYARTLNDIVYAGMDCFSVDQKIVFQHYGESTQYRDAGGAFFRFTDLNNFIFASVDHEVNLLRVYDLIAGVATLLCSVSYNPPEASVITVTASCIGTEVTIAVGGVSASGVTSILTGTKAGFYIRYGATSTQSRCYDFKLYI